jgi:hypothetical protein
MATCYTEIEKSVIFEFEGLCGTDAKYYRVIESTVSGFYSVQLMRGRTVTTVHRTKDRTNAFE